MGIHVGTAAGLFEVTESSINPTLRDTRINHVTEHDGIVWATDGKGQIHRNGEVLATLPDGRSGLCIQPSLSATWIGTSEARLFRYDAEGLLEDEFFAEAPGRDSWHTPWGGPPDVRSLTLDADHTLFVNVHVGGVLRYDNTGLVPTLDIDNDVHQVSAHPTQKGAIFAACAYGLAVAHNGHDFEIRDEGLHAKYCRAVAVADSIVFVSASTGPSTSRARVYRSALWDGPFEPLGSGLPDWFDGNVNTHCLLVKDGNVYVGHSDKIWGSDDSGESWTLLADGLPKITCLS